MSDTLYDWLAFGHIVAAMVWVGGGVLLVVLASRVLRGREPGAVSRFIASLRMIGPLVLAPATVAVVGLGVWLVLDSSAGGRLTRWSWGYRLIVLLRIAATSDMTMKPGL